MPGGYYDTIKVKINARDLWAKTLPHSPVVADTGKRRRNEIL